MPKERDIKVIVNMPTTEEGMARLRDAVFELNGYVLGRALSKVNASRQAKLDYLQSLNGKVPWARKPDEPVEPWLQPWVDWLQRSQQSAG